MPIYEVPSYINIINNTMAVFNVLFALIFNCNIIFTYLIKQIYKNNWQFTVSVYCNTTEY